MSIQPLHRITLCGLASDKEALLDELQGVGCVHLVVLRQSHPLAPADTTRLRRARSAYRHLTETPYLLRPWSQDREIDVDNLVDAALKNKVRLTAARDRRDFLTERIQALTPFGSFTFPPEGALQGLRFWFYVLPAKDFPALAKIDLPWQIVGRNQKKLYVVLIALDEPPADVLPVPRIHTGSRSLMELRTDLEEAEIEIEEAEVERAQQGRARLALGARLVKAEDREDRRAAAEMSRDEGSVFVLQGWSPVADASHLRALADRHGVALILDEPSPEDTPPTLLSNPGAISGASALTSFYKTPDYRTWDPSRIIFFSFVIFFAMILADAGYALVLGACLALFWRRMGQSEGGRQGRTLLTIILIAAFIYGVMAGAYFGIAPPKNSFLGRLAFIKVDDFSTMMKVSVTVGVLQLALANAEVAWRHRGTALAVESIAWIVVLFSGLMIWLTPSTVWHVILGLALLTVAVAASLSHPVKRPVDWLLRIAHGLFSLTHVSKLFGDVLSYMRLFALGLASASLAATFNHLAAEIAGDASRFGVLLAIIILLLGHGINIALGILSGVVHGLRLNYIEFFGWALPGEGYPFKPFKHRSTESWNNS